MYAILISPCGVNYIIMYSFTVLRKSKLSELNIPYQAHANVITKVTDYAHAAANEDQNMDCRIIPLVGTVKAAAIVEAGTDRF